ncbi:depupylase/deamidase Dop [Oryzobacter terrae]|uniref:depupylase/deamidase Dop n=1 Tax=Oryzobacter terrae TaxID=1620385 RepID=UPI00366B5930
MTVRRVMGIETEYGIVIPGDPGANPMVASGDVVTAYAASRGIRPARASWDYADEAPLRDARGFDMGRGMAHPSQLTDVEDPTLANVVLTNGARLYVDHAHPEYSSPEVTNPRDAVVWDRAGELVMREAVARLATVPPGVNLYKNNADGKGVSYGTHENYLMARSTPFANIVKHLTPFFVVRQVMCGSGRVGIGVDSRTPGYQIAQRSDFFEVEVGLETTLKRPIINTRDEPHAVADRYRRLHVILGDANHCDVANLLKMGSTSLVLGMIEADVLKDDLSVRRPVATLHDVSHDLTLQAKLELVDGRRMTALELLTEYFDRAHAWAHAVADGAPDADTVEVLHWWGTVLDTLTRDPMDARRLVDWVAKLAVLEGYRERDSLGWGDPRLKAVDLQWSDVRADRGLAHRLAATGRVEVLVDEADVRHAVDHAPTDTRAWFRGECLRRFADDVVAASWDSVIFDVAGQRTLQRVPMLEPLKGTEAGIGDLVRGAPDAASLLRALAAAGSEDPRRDASEV